MVRAHLAKRKSMTRRCRGLDRINMDTGRWHTVFDWGDGTWAFFDGNEYSLVNCPYGIVGDRLWGRETFCLIPRNDEGPIPKSVAVYRADRGPGQKSAFDGQWTPAIHMPRRFSRLLHEITEIRLERVNAITWNDAVAEGVQCIPTDDGEDSYWCVEADNEGPVADDPLSVYEMLWDRINGGGPKEGKPDLSWSANPWCWVLKLKEVQP